MVKRKRPVQKLKLKPKKRAGGTNKSNQRIEDERRRIEKENEAIRKRGPTEKFPGASSGGVNRTVQEEQIQRQTAKDVKTGTISRAKTEREKLRTLQKQRGIFRGTTEFIIGGAGRLEDLRQQKSKDFSRGEETRRGVQFATGSALFSSPAGPALLIGSGSEELKESPEEFRGLKSEGVGTTEAFTRTVGKGVAEVSLGVTATALRFSKVRAAEQAKVVKQAEKQALVGARVENVKGGVDVVVGRGKGKASSTQRALGVKDVDTLTISTSPFRKGKGVTTIEAGKTLDITRSGENIVATSSKVKGFSRKVRGSPSGVKSDAQVSAGVIKTETKAQLSGKLRPISSSRGIDLQITGQVTKAKGSTRTPFFTLSKQKGDQIFITGGSPKSLRQSVKTGKRSVKIKPQEAGVLKKADINKFTRGSASGSSTQTKVVAKDPATFPLKQLQKSSTVTKPPRVPSTKPIRRGSATVARPETQSIPQTIQESAVTQTTRVTTPQLKTRNFQTISQLPRLNQRSVTVSGTSTRQESAVTNAQRQESKIAQTLRVPSVTRQTQRQTAIIRSGRGGRSFNRGRSARLPPVPPLPKPFSIKTKNTTPSLKPRKKFKDIESFIRGFTANIIGADPIKITEKDIPKLKTDPVGIRPGFKLVKKKRNKKR